MLIQQDINEARAIIRGKVHRTPVVSATMLGEASGTNLFLKCEMLQKTGSFKPRGALNKLAHLSAAEKARGLISASAGNHAQGVAYAARLENVRATIVMPENAPQAKVNAVRGYGAEIVSLALSNIVAACDAVNFQETPNTSAERSGKTCSTNCVATPKLPPPPPRQAQ